MGWCTKCYRGYHVFCFWEDSKISSIPNTIFECGRWVRGLNKLQMCNKYATDINRNIHHVIIVVSRVNSLPAHKLD